MFRIFRFDLCIKVSSFFRFQGECKALSLFTQKKLTPFFRFGVNAFFSFTARMYPLQISQKKNSSVFSEKSLSVTKID